MLFHRPHQIGGHHGRNEPRAEQRKQYGDSDCQTKLFEVLPGDASHERDRCEDCDDGHRDGDNGKTDLVGSFERSAVGRFAHVHMAHDVFDLDDRVIDQNAGDQRNREQAHEIERKAHHRDCPERRDDGERQGNR